MIQKFRNLLAVLVFLVFTSGASLLNAETVFWNVAFEFDMMCEANPLGTQTPKAATRAAINAAHDFFEGGSNDRLVLYYPPGEYVFGDSLEKNSAIFISGLNPGPNGRLVIKGAGRLDTTFVINHNQSLVPGFESQNGIFVQDSARITVRDIHLTVMQDTVTQGTVIRKGGFGPPVKHIDEFGKVYWGTEWMDVRIDEGYVDPVTLSKDRQVDAFGRYIRRYTNHKYPRLVESVEQVRWMDVEAIEGVRVYRFLIPRKHNSVAGVSSNPLQFGDLIAVKSKHGKDPYRFVDCEGIIFQSILLSKKTRGLFLRCAGTRVSNIVAFPGEVNGKRSRLASPGGGPQFHARHGGYIDLDEDGNEAGDQGYRGHVTGTVVEDCHLVGTGDDGIGLFEQSNPIVRKCTFIDSFARSIYNYRSVGLKTSGNRSVRCGYYYEDERP